MPVKKTTQVTKEDKTVKAPAKKAATKTTTVKKTAAKKKETSVEKETKTVKQTPTAKTTKTSKKTAAANKEVKAPAKKTASKKASEVVSKKVEQKKEMPKKEAPKKETVKKANPKKTSKAVKLAQYNNFAIDTCIDMARAMGVDMGYDQYANMLLEITDLKTIANNIIDKYDLKTKKFSFDEDGYDIDLIEVLVSKIAVTVDMIATGTDVKPIECLIFMRDVRSKNYFEQMLGRATRTLDLDNLKKVSPSATERKLGFIVVDAVGVTSSQKTTSRQLERKPSESLKNLLNSVAFGAKDEDTLTSIANRFINLDKVLKVEDKDEFKKLTDGVAIIDVAKNILNAFDDDYINSKIDFLDDTSKYESTKQEIIDMAIKPIYNPEVRKFILEARDKHYQIIDNENIDSIEFSGWDTNKEEKAKEIIKTFAEFIEENKDSIDALNIIYNQSYKNRPLTYKMVEELYEKMMSAPYFLSNTKLWEAYSTIYGDKVSTRVEDKLADIISLIKFELKQTNELKSFNTTVNIKFKEWCFKQNEGYGEFSEEQMEWLRMIKDHIAISMNIKESDLELTPFNNKGGLAKFFQLFNTKFREILAELNYALLA